MDFNISKHIGKGTLSRNKALGSVLAGLGTGRAEVNDSAGGPQTMQQTPEG